MLDVLYNIFIFPIETILYWILSLYLQIFDSAGWSIIALSISVTIIMLPLFKIADFIQSKEQKQQKQMERELKTLADVPNIMERYFYTKEIYLQHKYKPIYALRGLMGLLVQLPFFIAAFSLLSNFTDFNDISFGVIKNLAMPDRLLKGMNILPFLMAIFSVIATYLHLRYVQSKQQILLYLMSLLFLILLYNQAAALTLYWLMNNVWLILKNLYILRKAIPVASSGVFYNRAN